MQCTHERNLLHGAIWIAALLMAGPVCAADENDGLSAAKTVLRSASEVAYPPFCFVDDQGRAVGFSVELMQAALANMGRDVTFRTGVWSEVQGWLKNGEVDALPLVGRTPERESLYEFTFPYMTLHGSIVVRSDTVSIRSFADLRGKRVAVMKGDNMEEFLRREEREFEIRTTATFEDALRELAAGGHDAVVIQRLVAQRLMQEIDLPNLRVLHQPIPEFRQDFCFAVKSGDWETLGLLNEGLALAMADGTFRRLHSKWFAALELPRNRRIIVGGDHNYAPYEFLDATGRPAGFNVDLTRAIAARMDLDIEIRLGPWAEIVEGLENGEIDVVQGMFYSAPRDRKFDFGLPHLLNHYVVVVREPQGPPPGSWEELAGKRIVVRRGDLILDALSEHGLSDGIALAESHEDALRELAEGQHDCALVVRISALHLIREHGWQQLRLGSRPLHTAEYCYAVAGGQNALLTQFSEGLATLRESGEYRRIHDQWLGVYDEPPASMLAALKTLAWIAGPVTLLLMGLYTWNWMLRREVARRTAALRRSEEQFRSFVEGAPDAIFVQTDNRFVYLNPAACRLLCADSPEQLVGQPVLERVHPDFHAMVLARIHQLTAEKTSVPKHQVIWLRLDGSEVPVEVAAVPIHFLGQMGCLVFAHDITVRKQTEETLRASRESYRDLIENLNEVVFSLELDGTIEFVSPVVRELFGDEPQELIGQHFLRDIHPDDVGELETVLADTIAGSRRSVHEFRVFDRSGRIHWVRSSARVRLANGQPDGVQGVLTDITEQKRAEEANERLIAAVEQSGESIVITDPVGTIQYVNAAFVAVAGFSREEAIGQNPRILKSGQHDQAFYRDMWNTVLAGSIWRGRIVNRRKDGSLYTVDAAISPVRDHHDRIVHLVGVSQDITEQIQREALLQQTQKMDSIGRLAGGIAHDFNNLLSVILGYAGLALQEATEGDLLYERLVEIRHAGERAAELTRQLLAFGRRQVLQPVAFDLNVVLADMDKMLRRIVGEDIDLRLVLDRDLATIVADPGQIEQVIMNLVINARDAMPKGGKLTIETANIEVDAGFAAKHMDLSARSYVRLAVTDTGCGMDAATVSKIFEPFFTTKESGEGTGLGLPTAHGIVKQSGGDIRVYTELGKGTTFKVYLPRTNQSPVDLHEVRPEKVVQARGEHVLVVEDELALRNLLENMLTALGYRVTLAADGFQALALVEQQDLRPDLVLTDVVMPGMSGKVLADRLQSQQPNLKVLFMSGYTDNAIIHHGVLDPGIPFIHKPFRRTELIAKITDLLTARPPSDAIAKTILMLDDDPAIRALTGWACENQGHRFVGVSNIAEALSALSVDRFDLLLIDMNLSGEDGESALRAIREAGHTAPAIMISGDAHSVDLDQLRDWGAMAAIEKSHDAVPLLELIERVGNPASESEGSAKQ